MATQKRLNKNLVAFLTVMGMALVIAVFGLIIYQQSRRDPKLLAENARQSAQAGDLEEAARRYLRAWDASETRGEPDTQYVISAAECLFQMGEIPGWRSLMSRMTAKLPNDQPLLVASLEGLWRIHEITGSVFWPDLWRDTSDSLLRLDEHSILGLTSRARALWELKGDENIAAADKAVDQAFALAPTDPRVALTYVEKMQRQVQAEARQALTEGRRPRDLEELARTTAEKTLEVLGASVAAHPEHVQLVTTYAETLGSEARRLDGANEPAAAAGLYERAGAALDAALALHAEQRSPDLCVTAVRHRLSRLLRENPGELEPARIRELRPQLEELDTLLQRAIEAEPAMYEAYSLRAELGQRFGMGPGGEDLPSAERLVKALEIFEKAREATLTLRNLRALLRSDDRLLMMRQAFEVSMGYYYFVSGQENERAAALARAESFLDDARIKYPDHPVTHYMHGQFLIARGDQVAAIGALEQALEKSGQLAIVRTLGDAAGQARFWLLYARTSRLPTEQLATLYRQRGQPGEAENNARRALEQYEAVGATPPVALVVNLAELLAMLNRLTDARDLLERYQRSYPNDREIAASLAAIKVRIDPQAGKEAIQTITGDDVGTRLWRAQRAIELEDSATAEQMLREVMNDAQATAQQYRMALQRWVALLSKGGRDAEALQLVRSLKENPPREGLARLLRGLELELAVGDLTKLTPEQLEELDAERIKLINENPDAFGRAAELYQFHALRGRWQDAAQPLSEMRRMRPDDIALVEEEFRLCLRMKQFERATELSAILTKHDGGAGADHAGGATYRGDLALARQDYATAIREFRQAVQDLPKSAELDVRLARAYLGAARWTEGVDVLEQALRTNPRSFEAWWYMRQANRQLALQSAGAERTRYEERMAECEAKAAEINPNHPDVKLWQKAAAEERNPVAAIAEHEQQRVAAPADAQNNERLAQLYARAWRQAVDTADTGLQQRLASEGDKFFQEATAQSTGEQQLTLATSASKFYTDTAQTAPGESLLRAVIEKQTGEGKIAAQLLLADFYFRARSPEAAEREFQQAQRMVRDVTQDADQRLQLEQRVGIASITFYRELGRLDKVVDACRWLLDRLGSAESAAAGGEIRLMLIEALLNLGRLAEATTEVDEYLKLYPDDVSGLTAQAQLALVKRDRDKALQVLTRILEKAPDDVLALYSRGKLMLERGRNDKALEDLKRALELVSRGPRLEADIRQQLVSLYTRTRQFDLAVNELRAILDLFDRQPGRRELRQSVVRRLVDLLYRSMDQFDRAQKILSEYMEKRPTEPLWPYELGRLFASRAEAAELEAKRAQARGDAAKEAERLEFARQGFSAAANYYQRAADQAGAKNAASQADATIARVNALTRAGREREAISVAQQVQIADLPPDLVAVVKARLGAQVARALQKVDPAAARQQWQQAFGDASSVSIILTGDLSTELGAVLSPEQAATTLREIAERAPLDSLPGQRLRVVLATYLARTNQAAAALPVLSEVLGKLAPGSPEHLTAVLAKAQALGMTGDNEGTVKTYREILEKYDTNVTALNNLAYSLVTNPPPLYAPAEARKYAEKLRGLVGGEPSAATMLDTVGWVYYKNDELGLAVATLEEALSLDDSDPAVYLHLAEVYQKLNRLADARATLNRALETARRNGAAEQVQKVEDALKQLP